MNLDVTPLMQAIEKYIAKADDDLAGQLANEGFVEAETAVESIDTIEDDIASIMGTEVDTVLNQIQTATNVDDFISRIWPTISSSDDMTDALHDIFYEQFEDLMHGCTKNWIIETDPDLANAITDDRITDPAEAFVKGWSQELSEIMHLDTNKKIENILLTAQQKNQTIEEVSQAIADSGIRQAGYRSRTVAVTEVLRVEEYAHEEARIQNPSCYKKVWRHNDVSEHPRENHIAMDGQEVYKREPFTLYGADGGTYYPMCPRDTSLPAGESINCHCSTEDVVDQDVLGMSLDDRLALRQQAMDAVDAEYEEYQEAFEEEYPACSDFEVYYNYYENLKKK